MVDADLMLSALSQRGVAFFVGVPDSLMMGFCNALSGLTPDRHIIAANEGAAIGLAIGYHLATGRVPLVYMQNSGLGNAINPLTSLADADVYSIPLILLIGWRGQPGVKDEPQHLKQGRITPSLLETLEIPFDILDSEGGRVFTQVKWASDLSRERSAPVALIACKDFFKSTKTEPPIRFGLTRERAILKIAERFSGGDVVISTTGMASRELYEWRVKLGQPRNTDFLTVGGMGHASQIALGIALHSESTKVVCIDGDGAVLMHLGSLPTIGVIQPRNLIHVVINNGSHDSVGGQKTVALDISLTQIALASGYKMAVRCDSDVALRLTLDSIASQPGPIFLEICVDCGHRVDLGRPTETPKMNKNALREVLDLARSAPLVRE